MKIDGIKPGQRKRYEFIEFQLMWEGIVGRKLLMQKFEISPQQATLDLTSYLDIAPKNMTYDPRQRTYVAPPDFQPAFIKGDASEYLLHLEMLCHGYREPDEIWPTTIPAFDAVAVASRKITPTTLKAVLHAIRDRKCVEVMYVSLSSQSETPRQLFPHAIASDGHRWHMRAYDGDKDRYSDFVLSRIEKIHLLDCQGEEIPEDKRWSSNIELILQPDPSLEERQKRHIQIEYDMDDGRLAVDVRQAMLFYYLRFYGFDPREKEGEHIRNKSSFHLQISNLEEVTACLDR
ncbi:WYL domain-containing protein [Emcibacter nanhaiensis]|nr:WYL domain-containing protein [Emcibacter nanhaiensis]